MLIELHITVELHRGIGGQLEAVLRIGRVARAAADVDYARTHARFLADRRREFIHQQRAATYARNIDQPRARREHGIARDLRIDVREVSDAAKTAAQFAIPFEFQATAAHLAGCAREAEKTLRDYEQRLKDGGTLPVDADVSKATAALDRLNAYAKPPSVMALDAAVPPFLTGSLNSRR